MKSRLTMEILNAAVLGAAVLLTACMENRNPSAGGEEVPAKVETSAPAGLIKPGETPNTPESAVEEAKRKWERDNLPRLGKMAAAGAWIQLVPKVEKQVCNFKAALQMDDEDADNANRLYVNGTNHSGKVANVGGLNRLGNRSRAGVNSKITVCQEFIPSLPVMKYDYAVLSGGETCPENSYRFMRRFDNEDENNVNYQWQGIWPNSAVNSYSQLYFCFVPGNSASPQPFPRYYFGESGLSMDQHYMIFAENHSYATSGIFGTDDEDNKNQDSFTNYGAPEEMFTRFQKIIRGVNGGGSDGRGRNTDMYFAAYGTPAEFIIKDFAKCGNPPEPPASCYGDHVNQTDCKFDTWHYEDAKLTYAACMAD